MKEGLQLFTNYFYYNLNLYIHISNTYLELGLGFEFEFEFGPQKIRDLAFVCLDSVLLQMGRNWKYLLRFTHLFFGVINVDPWGITFNINVFNVYVVYLEDQIFDFAFSTHLETKFFNLSERNGSTFFHEKRIPTFLKFRFKKIF